MEIKIESKKGISLIVLVITIVVMIILAATIILSLNGNNITVRSNEAKFKNDLAALKSELSVIIAEEDIQKAKDSLKGKKQEIEENESEMGIEVDNNYSKLIPDSLKKYVIISKNREIIYTNDSTLPQAKWAKDEQIRVIDNTLYNTIFDINELMDLARAYVEENNETVSPNLLALQYVRNKRSGYTGTAWSLFAGNVNTTFVNYVNSNKKRSLSFSNIVDSVTNEEVDLIHMMASLNVYYYRDYAMLYEYACWAGDLCTLAKQVNTYNSKGTYTLEQLVEYADTLLGTTESSSTFGLQDMLADVDAVNISNLLIGTDDLDKVFYEYYIGKNVDVCKNRYSNFYNYLIDTVYSDSNVIKLTGDDKIYDIAMSYSGAHSGATVGKAQAIALLGLSTYNTISLDVWKAVATSFSNYINYNK